MLAAQLSQTNSVELLLDRGANAEEVDVVSLCLWGLQHPAVNSPCGWHSRGHAKSTFPAVAAGIAAKADHPNYRFMSLRSVACCVRARVVLPQEENSTALDFATHALQASMQWHDAAIANAGEDVSQPKMVAAARF